MNNSAEKILYRKAALIFEELGFLMPRSETSGGNDNNVVEGKSALISFTGAFAGCLAVSLSMSLLPLLSSNMLGEQDSGENPMEHDALCEIANVICGNALPAIYGFKPIFHLSAPSLCNASETSHLESTFTRIADVRITFEAGCANVALYVEKNAESLAS
jgi:CheY-specific phosphatase CheX